MQQAPRKVKCFSEYVEKECTESRPQPQQTSMGSGRTMKRYTELMPIGFTGKFSAVPNGCNVRMSTYLVSF